MRQEFQLKIKEKNISAEKNCLTLNNHNLYSITSKNLFSMWYRSHDCKSDKNVTTKKWLIILHLIEAVHRVSEAQLQSSAKLYKIVTLQLEISDQRLNIPPSFVLVMSSCINPILGVYEP